jgi:hypothetical protein
MGRVEINIPLVTWRDGRPRFFPSPAARELGYKGEDLRHGRKGPWFSLDEAIAWSKACQLEIAEKRAAIAAGKTTVKRTAAATAKSRADGRVSISQVMEAYLSSPRMQGRAVLQGKKKRRPLADTTIATYRKAVNCLRNFEGGQWWHEPADDLTGPVLDGLVDAIEQSHGLAQARAVRGVISVAFASGRRDKLVHHNPAADSHETLPMLPRRVRPATVQEFVTLVAGADALGLHDIGDMLCAGAWTAQRQNDRRSLVETQISADGIMFAPHKKDAIGQRLLIPLSAMLAARIDAARARRKSRKVLQLGAQPVFLWEAGNVAWTEGRYGKVFRMLRQAVAFGTPALEEKTGKVDKEWKALFGARDVAAELAAAGVQLLPSVADLRDQDMRDTCLSWLARAGCNKWQVAGFSGHAFGGGEAVLGHYVDIDPSFAQEGMKKLEAWFARHLAELGQAGKTARS